MKQLDSRFKKKHNLIDTEAKFKENFIILKI